MKARGAYKSQMFGPSSFRICVFIRTPWCIDTVHGLRTWSAWVLNPVPPLLSWETLANLLIVLVSLIYKLIVLAFPIYKLGYDNTVPNSRVVLRLQWNSTSVIRAAEINYHKLGSFKRTWIYSFTLLEPWVQNRGISRALLPPEYLEETSPCLLQFLVAPGVPWLIAASLTSLPLSSHDLFSLSLLLFCLS